MQAKLERDLKIVMTLESGALVYSIPVSKAVFNSHYLALAKVYSTILAQGLLLTGPSIAARMLRELGKEQDVEVEPLVAEIRRLCMVASPNPTTGYFQQPLENAIKNGSVDEDDVDEIENYLVFSTAASYLSTRSQAAWTMKIARGLRGVEVTSSTFTDYLASLQTSTPEDNSGETPTP